MADHESQHDLPAFVPVSGLPASPEGSTVAAPVADPPSDGLPMGPPTLKGGSSAVRSESLTLPVGGRSASDPLPTDKTVISKRPPLEAPLPPLPTPQSLGQSLIGKTLDHYELVEFVGGGGMGAVFRSVDTRLGRTVAVKVLSRDHTDEETIKRFRNEAQSAARLDHPNIARVYFVGEAEGWNYIVFEYIEGTNLRDIVDARGPLPLEEALNYTLQVAEALDHASNRDVVHRDIKPSNVLVTPSGQVKLVDMGLARLHQVETDSEDLTASGVMLGTFDYISPEQARDPRSADVRSDIYSLGCTLYFMLAGRPPFPDGTAVQKLLKHNSEEPPDLRLFRPELPQPAVALVNRMLAKRPSQRHQQPQELRADVLALAQHLGLTGLIKQANVIVAPATSAGSFWSRALPIAVPIAALILTLWMIDVLSRQGDKGQSIALRPVLEPAEPVAETTEGATRQGSDGAAGKQEDQPGAAAKVGGEGGSERAGSEERSTTSSPPTLPATVTGNAPRISSDTPAGADNLRNGVTASPATSGGESTPGVTEGAETGATAEPARRVERIIVRRDEGEAAAVENAEVVGSLARACQIADELGVSEIELQFHGQLVEQPFDIPQKPQTHLRIRAGDDPQTPGKRYQPVIVFRPKPQHFGTDQERQMIRLLGGTTSTAEFQGVELRLEMPAESSSGWALLTLQRMQRLVLADCVLTIVDAAGNAGAPVQDQVAMLALQPRPVSETMKMMEDGNAMIPSMDLRLSRCIARGPATLLVVQDESPLKFSWTQGLLVTPYRLLESRGASIPRPTGSDVLQIDLEHVTAIAGQGLVAQKRRPTAAAQLGFEVRCQSCVLISEPTWPLFEFEDLTTREEVKLLYEGDDNLYPPRRDVLFLRFGSSLRSEAFRPREWGSEFGSGQVAWAKEPPQLASRPAHEHVPAMYLLDPVTFPPEDVDLPGFDPGRLPVVADAAPASTATEAAFFE